MKIELPKMPAPKGNEELSAFPGLGNRDFKADQMREYAISAVMEERERCAKLCEGLPVGHLPASPQRQGAVICAQSIRNQPEPA